MTDRIRTAPDVRFRSAGVGMVITFRCMGCHQIRSTAGSRGLGIAKRCAGCVASRKPAVQGIA